MWEDEILSMRYPELEGAIEQYNATFGQDDQLVRVAATQHHVEVRSHDWRRRAKEGAYNLLLPLDAGRTAQAIAFATKELMIGCMDRRISAQVPRDIIPGPSVYLTNAGGFAQPNTPRLEVLVDFIVQSVAANPDLQIVGVVHNGICGGADHYTGGRMHQLIEDGGPGADTESMILFGRDTRDLLFAHGVPRNSVTIYLAEIDGQDEYTGLSPIQ